jgi:uncharacterized delta-60 repeat protein
MDRHIMKQPVRIIHCFAVMVLLQAAALCFNARGAAGDVDLTFDAGSCVNLHEDTALAQPDGKVLIAGSCTTVDGFARPGLARLHADGSDDVSFTPAAGFSNIAIVDIVLQADGRILVCGQHKGYAANASAARLNSDGSFTAATGTYPRYPYGEGIGYTSVVAQPDGKVLLCGYFTDYFVDSDGGDNYAPRSFIVRLDPNGAFDTSFAAAIRVLKLPFSNRMARCSLAARSVSILKGTAARLFARLKVMIFP